MPTAERYPARLHRHLLAEFKGALRELRERAGQPTFRTMTRRTGTPASTLWRAQSGVHVPSIFTTLSYVEACDGDQRLWADQHRDLMVGLNGDHTAKPIRFVPWRDYFDQEGAPPPPTVIVLRKEMRRLWLSSGKSLQEIADQTAELRYIVGDKGIGTSTISDLCNPDKIRVPERRTLHAFLKVVGASPTVLERWMAVRSQLAAKHDQRLNTVVNTRPRAKAMKTGPVSITAGETVIDPGHQLIERLRRVRTEIARAGTSKAVSEQRIRTLLLSLGVDPAVVVSIHSSLLTIFVLNLHQMTEGIMAEAELPSSASALVLELAVGRVSNEYLQMRAVTFAPEGV